MWPVIYFQIEVSSSPDPSLNGNYFLWNYDPGDPSKTEATSLQGFETPLNPSTATTNDLLYYL